MMIVALLLSLAVQDAPGSTVVVTGKKERKICKATNTTGSRMARTRDCRTAAQWRAAEGPSADPEMLNESVNAAGYNSGHITVKEPGGGVARPTFGGK